MHSTHYYHGLYNSLCIVHHRESVWHFSLVCLRYGKPYWKSNSRNIGRDGAIFLLIVQIKSDIISKRFAIIYLLNVKSEFGQFSLALQILTIPTQLYMCTRNNSITKEKPKIKFSGIRVSKRIVHYKKKIIIVSSRNYSMVLEQCMEALVQQK